MGGYARFSEEPQRFDVEAEKLRQFPGLRDSCACFRVGLTLNEGRKKGGMETCRLRLLGTMEERV